MTSPSGTLQQGGSNAAMPGNISRIFSLDVLRGIALLGILIVSIWQFGGISPNQQNRLRLIHHGGNYNLFAAVSILFEGKMRALFSMLFGAGIMLFFSRQQLPSRFSTTDLYIRRQMWLIAFGIFNAVVLLWPGDILYHYGILGILLFVFWRLPARSLLIASIITTLIFCGKNLWDYNDDKKAYKKFLAITEVEKRFSKDSLQRAKADSIWSLQHPKTDTLASPPSNAGTAVVKKLQNDSLAKQAAKDTLNKEQKKDKEAWLGTVKRMKYDSAADISYNKAMRGSYVQVWKQLLPDTQYRESMWLYKTGIWDIGSMMLLGMALFAFGFFSDRYSIKKYLFIAIPALLLGLFLAWMRQEQHYARLADYAQYVQKNIFPYNQFFPFERVLLATAYASIVMILIRIRFFQWLWRALADVGRMAFTNYLMQTIICTIFFYGYGIGNFGRLSQLELYFVVAEVWLVQLVFSVFWFRLYTIGPLEWLWRRLTYGIWFPIKKKSSATIDPVTTTTN